MLKQPNVTQKVLFKHNNEILLMRHEDGIYDFPGGRVEWEEELLASLNRELKEELNYGIKKMPELFHVWNYISKDKTRHSVMVYYLHKLKRRPQLTSPEGMEILWVNKKKMGEIIEDKEFVKKIFLS